MVRAYFQGTYDFYLHKQFGHFSLLNFVVAYKRIIDYLPLAVDREIVRINKRSIYEEVASGLHLTDSEAYKRCAALLVEPRRTKEKRKELENRLERLREANMSSQMRVSALRFRMCCLRFGPDILFKLKIFPCVFL